MDHKTGLKNVVVRLYFYCSRGMDLVNQFRNLFLLIFGVYFTFKLAAPVWLAVMFSVAVPGLILAGWVQVNHMAKTLNWLEVEYASHWTRYSFELQEKILEELKRINTVSEMSEFNRKNNQIPIDTSTA